MKFETHNIPSIVGFVIIAIVVVFALAGCVDVGRGVVAARVVTDEVGQLVKSGNCAVTLGAMIRGYSASERTAAELLCNGSMGR